MGGHAGVSILTFNVTSPGRYRVSAGYDDNRTEPKTVLTVATGFLWAAIVVMGGDGILWVQPILPIAIVAVTAVKRRQARKAAAVKLRLPVMALPRLDRGIDRAIWSGTITPRNEYPRLVRAMMILSGQFPHLTLRIA